MELVVHPYNFLRSYKMYQLGTTDKLANKPSCIVRTSDNTSIPFDPANTDYQAYLAWVEAGGVPLPAEETQ